MKISLRDRSLYLKGLMLLIRKDRHIHDKEIKMMMRFGEILGFEKEFCEDAIKEVLDNKYMLMHHHNFLNLILPDTSLKMHSDCPSLMGRYTKRNLPG